VPLTHDHIPPRFSRRHALKITMSQPWPTEWAAAENPEMPAPVTAMRGPVNAPPVGGGEEIDDEPLEELVDEVQ